MNLRVEDKGRPAAASTVRPKPRQLSVAVYAVAVVEEFSHDLADMVGMDVKRHPAEETLSAQFSNLGRDRNVRRSKSAVIVSVRVPRQDRKHSCH